VTSVTRGGWDYLDHSDGRVLTSLRVHSHNDVAVGVVVEKEGVVEDQEMLFVQGLLVQQLPWLTQHHVPMF